MVTAIGEKLNKDAGHARWVPGCMSSPARPSWQAERYRGPKPFFEILENHIDKANLT